MFGNNRPFSYSLGPFTPDDLYQQRRAFHQDDFHQGGPLQRDVSRPSGRSIYKQRKEYSETLNRQSDSFQVRVEHLFTCELNGQDVRTVEDCVAKLKNLYAKGRLWPQEMIMEVEGAYLLLSDIETKAELESMPLNTIVQTEAVLDSCEYHSLLTVTVQERRKLNRQVFMFQCEEIGAELIKSDLDKAVQKGGGNLEPSRQHSDTRNDLENIIGQQRPGSFKQGAPHRMQEERNLPPPDLLAPQWREPGMSPSRAYTPQEKPVNHPDLSGRPRSPEFFPDSEMLAQRNTDILNHILNDLEIFMANVLHPPQEDNKKKSKKNKKSKKTASAPTHILPPLEEYVSCLQKIKYGFNLLSQLEGKLDNPSAPDYVHIFFSSLNIMVPQYPIDLPPTVLSPLLIDSAVGLLERVVSPEEDRLWRSLGDSWNTPRSRWPDDNVPPYIPEFYDGWQPPAPPRIPSPSSYQSNPVSRSNSQRFPARQPEEPMINSPWNSPSPPPTYSNEPPMYMRCMYDFTARNGQELSVMKGEVVQVVQKNKQWWLVRNQRNKEGNVPQNLLEPTSNTRPMEEPLRESPGPVTLNMSSSPADVKAWLEHKGFSKITIRSLGVLNGALLLGMSKNDIRTVCPEEGGKVFFQLQAVKSAIALASEPSGMYNGRY